MKYRSSVWVAFLCIVLFLLSYFIPSLKVDTLENRTMASFKMVLHPEVDSIVYHRSPVERLDAALSDQFPFRDFVIKQYFKIFNGFDYFTSSFAALLSNPENHQYSLNAIGNYALIGETNYITLYPSSEPIRSDLLEKHISQIELIHQLFPDLKMYVYYVTQAFDTDWFDKSIGVPTANHYQEIKDAIPDYIKSDHLIYQDLADYMNIHYKTDHHWNHKGARRGYENVYNLMKDDFEFSKVLVPSNENNVSQTYDFKYLGSYGRALGELYDGGYDEFSFYEYDLPQRSVAVFDPATETEIEVETIGRYDEYNRGEINKTIGTDHYIQMYGIAEDKDGNTYGDGKYLFIIRNSEGNGMNLLLCGDSYNRAMRDLIASHFDTTVYMDYRTLSTIPIDIVIERYDIDALLISSHTSMWNDEEFFFTFSEEE